MKTMKKILCSTLALVGVCAFSGGLAFAASADTTIQIERNAFEMQYGASVRKAEPAGIRFTALVGKDVYNEVSSDPNKDFGMFIVPDSYMEDYEAYIASNPNYEGKYYEYFSEQKKMIDFTYTPDQLTEKDGGYLMRGALSNVLFENLTREFVGVAYIKTTTKNDISYEYSYEYADFNRDDNARSISYVASAAINEGEGNDALDSYLAKSAYKLMGVTYNKETEKYVSGINAYGALEDIEAISPKSVYALPSPTLALTIDNAASVTSQNLSCLSVKYKSDREDIVSVDDKGVVTALKEGTATITATVGKYSSTRKVNAVFSDYYEFDATEFVDTKPVAAYEEGGLKYGKTGTYKFTGNNGDSEINAKNTTHQGEHAIYENPEAVRENLNGKGYKYIAMNFALSSGASICVVGSSIYGTLGMTFTDGSALAYAGTVAATTQAPYFHVYKNGEEVAVGDTIEDGVWYTVVVKLLLDPTGSSQDNIEDEWSAVGFGEGNDKAVYISGGRYYTNESFKDDYIYDYVEYGADEFVDTKGTGGYAAVDGRVFGRSNVYQFASTKVWTYEIGALHTVHATTAKDRIYQDSWQVAENATAHGWQYIAIDFALGANDTMHLVNTIPDPNGPKPPTTTGGLELKAGAVPTYRTTSIDTDEEKGWYKIYSAGKEIAIGGTETLADGVWYTVVVKLLMGTELASQFRNVGFGAVAGNIYISGVRYYVNDNFKDDYIYDYVEYGADEFVDTKNVVGGYAAVDGRVFGRSNVYKFASTKDWTYEIGALHTVHASTAKDRIYQTSWQVAENATAHGWQYIAIDFALGANDTMHLVNTIPDPNGTGTTTGGLVLEDGAVPTYRNTLIDTDKEKGWYKIYSEGKEIAIDGTEALADGVWYTVVVKLLMGTELTGQYRNIGFGGAAAGNIYISGVRYYVNDNFTTEYTTLEDYYEYGAEEVIDVKVNGAYSVAPEEIYGKDNVYMFTGNGWNNQIDVRKTTHIGYDKGSGAFYSTPQDARDSLIAKGIQYVAVEFALAPGAAVSLLGIIPYTGSNNNENGGLNFADGSALAYRPSVDTAEEKTYFTVYANGEKVAIGDIIEDGVWYTVVVKLQLDVNKANAETSYVNVGFGATGKGITYISGVRYYTNDSYKTDYAEESEENFPPEENEIIEYTAYFFDAESGSDDNDGLSIDAPKASVSAAMEIAATASPNNPVKLLFKKGSTFTGKAIFEGYEATKDFPLILDAYGDGEGYPKFVGTGSETTKNAIDAVLYFKNDNVWVMNLEVTGPTAYQGIAFQPVSGGAFKNIRIEGNYVHDINFNWTYSTAPAETNPDNIDVRLVCPGDNADGRYAYRKYAAICLDNDYAGAPVWFEDVWIANNRVENVGKIGINVYNRWNNKGGVGYGYNRYVDGTENHNDPSKNLGNYPNKNVYVVGNNLSCCGGDGLVISGVKGGAIENNVSYYANYLGREGFYNASIWVFASEDVLFQYNEAAYTYMRHGGQDAQGFDIDNACRNIIFRYNYSHHNEGGGLLLCDNTTKIDQYDANGNLIQEGAYVSGNWGDNYIYGNVFAYNGIVKDPVRSAFITISRKVSNVYIFNNTIVMSGEIKGQHIVNVEQSGCSDHYYYNNVFYSEKTSGASFDLSGVSACYFNGNLFYNVTTNGISTNQNARTYDPKMTGLDGRETSDFNGFDALSFFVPQESKVWTDGVNLPEKALEAKLNEDALGNKTGNVHLGALVG